MTPRKHRAIFLSDVHLGTRGCQHELLLDFLRHNDADTIYLVGDIVDGWKLKSSWYWPQGHNDVVQKLLRKVRKGARIVYVPGNHDEFLRDFEGGALGGIELVPDAIHVAADGRRYLVIHGDFFDVVVRHAKWLALLGDGAYEFALWLNTHVNTVRRRLGFTYWSLSAWAKLKVKNAVNFIGRFETTLAEEARRRAVDGVICGHIHHAAIRDIEGVAYVNSGDWVESCTAIVEDDAGRMEIIRWTRPLTVSERSKPLVAARPRRLPSAEPSPRPAAAFAAGSASVRAGPAPLAPPEASTASTTSGISPCTSSSPPTPGTPRSTGWSVRSSISRARRRLSATG